jgi:hypothetical protein
MGSRGLCTPTGRMYTCAPPRKQNVVPEDYHGRKPTARRLREIFRLETERGISNDWVIRHKGGNLQLKPGSRRYGPTRSKALVCEWEDGTMKVYYRGEAIAFTELKKQPESLCPDSPAPGPWWCGRRKKTIRGANPTRLCGHQFPRSRSERRSLGCALTLRPKLQGFASVGIPTRKTTTQKGDISNKLTMGTFLISLDTRCTSTCHRQRGGLPF